MNNIPYRLSPRDYFSSSLRSSHIPPSYISKNLPPVASLLRRYRKVADEGTEEEGEGEGGSEDKTKTALVKAGVETGGGWGTWPKEEDIFDGTFSNIVPGDAGGREDDAVLVERNERGELPEGLQHGEGWKCLLCLNVNDLGLVKCGCCERRRLR